MRSFGTSSSCLPVMWPPNSANAPPASRPISVGLAPGAMPDFIAVLSCTTLSNCFASVSASYTRFRLALKMGSWWIDSAVCEISSSAAAQLIADPRLSPPNATGTPAITCRRVGVLTNARDRRCARCVWGTEPGVSDELGGSGGGDFAYGRIDPPGAHFQSEPEAGV